MALSATQRQASKQQHPASQSYSARLAPLFRYFSFIRDSRWRQKIISILRAGRHEPLLHFVLLGALIFVLDRAFIPSSAQDQRIVINAQVEAELTDTFAQSRGRPPNPEELQELIQGWVQNEVLYREGLAMGLDQGDPMIRERVIQKMHLVVRNSTVVPPPPEQELRRWFEARRARYHQPVRFDFMQVFMGDDKPEVQVHAEQLRVALTNGAALPPETASDSRAYRRRTRDNVVAMFGERFAAALQQQTEKS
jgi:hypothetical protein